MGEEGKWLLLASGKSAVIKFAADESDASEPESF
jgi:hypothetical protein